MMRLAQRVQAALEAAYHPDGFNLGMNLGPRGRRRRAGHLHMHLLPRWTGDTNFMTTVGETRVEPEELSTTYDEAAQGAGVALAFGVACSGFETRAFVIFGWEPSV